MRAVLALVLLLSGCAALEPAVDTRHTEAYQRYKAQRRAELRQQYMIRQELRRFDAERRRP
jgi:starvation-inducible outer membrane lipoprotein